MGPRAAPLILALAALAALVTGGCRDADRGAPPTPSEAAPAAPTPVAVTPLDLTVLALNGDAVDVTLPVPAGWTRNEEIAHHAWAAGPAGLPFAPRFTLRVSCGGSCAPAALPGNIERKRTTFRERAARPNVNTGDPDLDAVRAAVTPLVDEALPDGRMIALRVEYAAEVLAAGPYQPDVRLLCLHHRPGDRFFVELYGRAPLRAEAAALPALRAACEGLVVHGPAASERGGRPPIAVEATGGLLLSAIPTTAYAVTSRGPDGTPYAIELERPVVLNGVPISPDGAVYLQGAGPAIRVRDFVLHADHALPLSPGLADGDRVPCKAGERVALFADGTVKRCMLAADTVVGGATMRRFGVADFQHLVEESRR